MALTEKYLGRYLIERSLGAGGMGEVYRAVDTRLDRTVAVKLLLPQQDAPEEATLRFLNEARVASSLNHPNIVALYDIARDRDRDFLVMEYVEGRTLKEMIPPGGMKFEDLAELGSQVAVALGTAHAAGIVHRDIKPANIMVTAGGQVKVLDFGLAHRARNTADTRVTAAGFIVGTVEYMSPEQTRGEKTDARSDIFSLGSLLYEMATGLTPFRGENPVMVLRKIAFNDAEAPSALRRDLPVEFVRLVMRCLAKERTERPESAMELATELKAMLLGTGPVAAAKPRRRLVAVMPLKVRGASSEQYLSVSLAEAVVHRLSESGEIMVRPMSSMVRYAGEDADWTRAAREVNADVMVEGTVQVAGGRVRLMVQVHQVGDSAMLASIKQDGDAADLFGLQDRLVDSISAVFLPHAAPSESRTPPTTNPAAYELYLRAIDRQVHVDKFEMASAIDMLTRATELDPGFADAWGLLAQACSQMGSHLDTDPKWFELGEKAIARALELDPVQCNALCARSMILWSAPRAFQNRPGLRALNAALKIDPGRPTARHQRSAMYWHLGFLDAAQRDALELTVTSPLLSRLHQGAIAMQRGDFDGSIAHYKWALGADPNGILMHVMSPIAILFAGRLQEAGNAIQTARQLFPRESFSLGLEAVLEAINGNHVRAEKLADEAGKMPLGLTHTHHTWHSCAETYALCGKADKAVDELERCAAMGLPNYQFFVMDPFLKPLHGYERFGDLMSRLRREHDSIRDEFGL